MNSASHLKTKSENCCQYEPQYGECVSVSGPLCQWSLYAQYHVAGQQLDRTDPLLLPLISLLHPFPSPHCVPFPTFGCWNEKLFIFIYMFNFKILVVKMLTTAQHQQCHIHTYTLFLCLSAIKLQRRAKYESVCEKEQDFPLYSCNVCIFFQESKIQQQLNITIGRFQ